VDIIFKVRSKTDESVRNVRHPVNGRMVLGRGPDSAVPLEAPGISREHLEVHAEDSALFLTDLSSNGTWINGARMPQARKCKVREGDFIEVPGYEIQFQLGVANSPRAAPAAPTASGLSRSKPRVAGATAAARSGRSLAALSTLERFLLLVAFACVVLLVLYLIS
jgi:predicted component of type VI protein secretion system